MVTYIATLLGLAQINRNTISSNYGSTQNVRGSKEKKYQILVRSLFTNSIAVFFEYSEGNWWTTTYIIK
jgi:hypothetical protein